MKPLDLTDASILITGGTGSFGRALVKSLLKDHKPRRIIVYSRDEWKQSDMQSRAEFSGPAMRYFIGDVRDRQRLELAMRDVDYVVHAAAMKQVPAAEYNPMEAVKTNINGAENVVNAALVNRVKGVIALSTDKAANPINLYGATKLASDKIFAAANNLSGSLGTKFGIVRYGNVLGSRGSVIPFFQRLIAEGATSLPITDPRMTRFWITVDAGVEFVLTSMGAMRGGELFVPKIPSMTMLDLAHTLAPGLATHVVGIRPGEKLHECLITEDEARMTLELADRYVVIPASTELADFTAHYAADRPRTVPEGFYYASHLNDRWLAPDDLLNLLQLIPDQRRTDQRGTARAVA